MKELKNKQKSLQSSNSDIQNFLEKVQNTPLATSCNGRGRLIFALDATASREGTWDKASKLQGDMFVKTQELSNLDVQLVYYRGYIECRSSRWVNNANALLKIMQSVRCEAGATQIARVLRHALGESKTQSIQAIVFVGDCVEEDPSTLYKLCGKLKIVGLPLFIFQEGYNAMTQNIFQKAASISGGAHCQFDQNSAQQLGDLLNAVATYATGGHAALSLLADNSHSARLLLKQLHD